MIQKTKSNILQTSHLQQSNREKIKVLHTPHRNSTCALWLTWPMFRQWYNSSQTLCRVPLVTRAMAAVIGCLTLAKIITQTE